jgi:hypothetical protein
MNSSASTAPAQEGNGAPVNETQENKEKVTVFRKKRLNEVFLFITSKCNSKCKTCFYHEFLNSNQDMTFENGNWTCYYSWPNASVRQRFREDQLSNNHLLTADKLVSQKILNAQPGDHIRIKGRLVTYANASNHFKRGTSTSRTDRGQGACEVIYINTFEFIQKANKFQRTLFDVSKSILLFSLFVLFLLAFTSKQKSPSLEI